MNGFDGWMFRDMNMRGLLRVDVTVRLLSYVDIAGLRVWSTVD